MNPLTKIPAIKIPGLAFQVCTITPVLAADWLKLNRKNRKLKTPTVEAYARDMKNEAWSLTHQGIAFDADGNLIDGQHRLQAVIKSKRSVLMFVSAGWITGGKQKIMDAVDRGANRSLADQLHLQHGLALAEAGSVVRIANGIAAACLDSGRVRKGSTACVLSVFELYAGEIKWLLANPIKTNGLKSATVASVLAMARAAWPEKTSDFRTRLKTGENLARGNPILELRNWLMGDGASSATHTQRIAICHHLHAFIEGRPLNSLVCSSNASLLHLLKLQGERRNKIRALYQTEAGTIVRSAGEETGKVMSASPVGPDALRVGGTLSLTFTSTDLLARLDNPNLSGLWISDWRRRGWIESAGVRDYRKTETFGKS